MKNSLEAKEAKLFTPAYIDAKVFSYYYCNLWSFGDAIAVTPALYFYPRTYEVRVVIK